MLNENGFSFSFKATLSMDSFDLLPEIWDSYEKLHLMYNFVRYSPTIDQTNLNNNDENFEKWKKSLDIILKKEYNFISTHGYPLWNWFSNIGKLQCNLNIIHIKYLCQDCFLSSSIILHQIQHLLLFQSFLILFQFYLSFSFLILNFLHRFLRLFHLQSFLQLCFAR